MCAPLPGLFMCIKPALKNESRFQHFVAMAECMSFNKTNSFSMFSWLWLFSLLPFRTIKHQLEQFPSKDGKLSIGHNASGTFRICVYKTIHDEMSNFSCGEKQTRRRRGKVFRSFEQSFLIKIQFAVEIYVHNVD